MAEKEEKNYDLTGGAEREVEAPELDYRPPRPKSYRPRIGLIACGGITKHHLSAYRKSGWDVVALCDKDVERAMERQKEFYPEAKVYADHSDLLERDDIDVVDTALHPAQRAAVIEDALRAGKHVLSQKPFVLDLDVGEKLVALAMEKGVKLAVNQNGRWAPYVRYGREAIAAGLLGGVQSVNISINWDHTWCKGTPFEEVHHLILYDFAIHWIDMTQLFFKGQEALSAYATVAYAKDQEMKPPMLGGAVVSYEGGLASLMFDGHSRRGSEERLNIAGSKGTYRASGDVCKCQDVRLYTEEGLSRISLEGQWFDDGFVGSMGELLCAIEEGREPENSGRNNLESLKLCFAILASADSGRPVKPGEARKVGGPRK